MTIQNQTRSAGNRLTGRPDTLSYEGSTGKVSRAVKGSRANLYTSYASNTALLNTPAKRFWTGAIVAAAIAAPFLIKADWTYLLTMVCIMAIGGIGLNLLSGYAGQISLGHAFFVGLGAYSAAVVGGDPAASTYGLGLDLSLALIAAAVIPAVIGFIVAPLATRVRGLYLAVLTLGLLMAGEHLFKSWAKLTGGQGVGRAPAKRTLFGMDLSATWQLGPFTITPQISLYLLALTLLIVLGVAARNLVRGRYGRAFAAVRDRDIAAEVMGVNLLRTKTLAFAISAGYAGIAGALLSVLVGRISPEQWNLLMSIDFLAIVVIGGAASISGSIIGAIFVVLVPRLIQDLSKSGLIPGVATSTTGEGFLNVYQFQAILFGALIILFMAVEPRGLYGLWVRIRNYFKAWPFSY